MHTIFVPEAVAFGGAERGLLALGRWFHAHDVPFQFLLYYNTLALERYADFPLKTVVLSPPRNPLAKMRALKRFMGTSGDAPHKPLVTGYQAALHASMVGLRGFHTLMWDTPSLFGNQGKAQNLKQLVRQKIEYGALRRGLGSGGKTIVNSEFLAQESRELFGGDVVVARMGGKANAAQLAPRPIQDRLNMLSLSRLEDTKRIDWILESLGQLERASPRLSDSVDWHLDVVGDGSLREAYTKLTQSQGLGRRVTFHGFVDDARLDEIYRRTNLFLMPARQGYGLPAVEALYSGVPVLLHRESGVSDLLLDTPWCEVFEGGLDQLTPALSRAVASVLAGRHIGQPLPKIPSEDDWSEAVARLCGWNPA